MGEQSTAVHTPGPWVFIDATKVAAMRYAPTCVIQAGNKQVASFSWNDNSPHFPSKSESQANTSEYDAMEDQVLRVMASNVGEG